MQSFHNANYNWHLFLNLQTKKSIDFPLLYAPTYASSFLYILSCKLKFYVILHKQKLHVVLKAKF